MHSLSGDYKVKNDSRCLEVNRSLDKQCPTFYFIFKLLELLQSAFSIILPHYVCSCSSSPIYFISEFHDLFC